MAGYEIKSKESINVIAGGVSKTMIKLMMISTFILLGILGCSDGQEITADIPEVDVDFLLEPMDFENFTILEGIHGFPGDRMQALEIEQAATIGASYVLDMFDIDMSGRYMELTFNYNPHLSISTWIGNIGDSLDEFQGEFEGFHPAQIVFTIDAISGERMSIWDNLLQSDHSLGEGVSELDELELLASDSEPLTEEEMTEVTNIAFDYAKRHFHQSTVVSVETGTYFGGEEEFVTGFTASVLNFVATDDADRVVAIEIAKETRQLLTIYTPIELLVPNDE